MAGAKARAASGAHPRAARPAQATRREGGQTRTPAGLCGAEERRRIFATERSGPEGAGAIFRRSDGAEHRPRTAGLHDRPTRSAEGRAPRGFAELAAVRVAPAMPTAEERGRARPATSMAAKARNLRVLNAAVRVGREVGREGRA